MEERFDLGINTVELLVSWEFFTYLNYLETLDLFWLEVRKDRQAMGVELDKARMLEWQKP